MNKKYTDEVFKFFTEDEERFLMMGKIAQHEKEKMKTGKLNSQMIFRYFIIKFSFAEKNGLEIIMNILWFLLPLRVCFGGISLLLEF